MVVDEAAGKIRGPDLPVLRQRAAINPFAYKRKLHNVGLLILEAFVAVREGWPIATLHVATHLISSCRSFSAYHTENSRCC